MKALWRDNPEWAAKMRHMLKTQHLGRGRKKGTPDGMTYKQFAKAKEEAAPKIKKVMEYMARHDEFEPDNKVAAAAIENCVTILTEPIGYETKLKAAKILLEYTQKKPVVANETTLKNAEAFLDGIVNDDNSATGGNS